MRFFMPGAEARVYRTGEKNRFFMIATAEPQRFDHVILGASHAMPLGFADMEERLEKATGKSIINLSNEGAGILPNRLVLDYFLRRHEAENVIYILDSFAFYSPAWNEERLRDAGLFAYAPLDPDLVMAALSHRWAWPVLPNYLSGFGKINNLDRRERDVPEAELTKFERTYRPNPRIDAQRIAYLYNVEDRERQFSRYLEEFQLLAAKVRESGARLTVVKPPTPARYRDNLPGEAEFDAAIKPLLQQEGISFHDFSGSLEGDEYYYDTDHMNRQGVLQFTEKDFVPLLNGSRN